jgi:hypothetical protein
VEFAVALAIGSVSLFADSIDFLEDVSVNLLIVVAIGWRARNRARLGMALAGILLVPGLATGVGSRRLDHEPARCLKRIGLSAARQPIEKSSGLRQLPFVIRGGGVVPAVSHRHKGHLDLLEG